MSGYQTESQRQQELHKPKLLVRGSVIEARGLRIGDIGGTSDPFTEVRIKNTSHAQQTKTIKKTLNPFCNLGSQTDADLDVGNEEFIVYPPNPETDYLSLKVYDWDQVTSNDLLGELEIPVSSIIHQPPSEQWKQLQDRKGHGEFKPGQGEIKLYLQFIPADQPLFSGPQIVYVPVPVPFPVNTSQSLENLDDLKK